jgi:hypothetical protein
MFISSPHDVVKASNAVVVLSTATRFSLPNIIGE